MEVTNQIKKVMLQVDYMKGISYPLNHIKVLSIQQGDDCCIGDFKVESQFDYGDYECHVEIKYEQLHSFSCTCKRFLDFHSCKHIVAVLYHYQDQLWVEDMERKITALSSDILYELASFQQLKEQVYLDVEVSVETNSYYGKLLGIKMKIGQLQRYLIHHKMGELLESFSKQNKRVFFGKKFEYDPKKHFFSKIDEAILQFFLDYGKFGDDASVFHLSLQNFTLMGNASKRFLSLLENKDFYIKDYGLMRGILQDHPFSSTLKKVDEKYQFSMDVKGTIFPLCDDYTYIFCDGLVYHLPTILSKLYQRMQENHLEFLAFSKEELFLFNKGIFSYLQECLSLDESVFQLSTSTFKPRVYLDIEKDSIQGKLTFFYGNVEVDFFDSKGEQVLRDFPKEMEVANELLFYHFRQENAYFSLVGVDNIASFLGEPLESLMQTYDVLVSLKLQHTKLVKTSIKSHFSIGYDQILHYSFSFENISNEEISSILKAFREKKKYYLLKNGNILSLDENTFQPLENFMDDFHVAQVDGVLPCYHAFYLDSLRDELGMQTNTQFDTFVKHFKQYQRKKVNFSDIDQTILRDYQMVGIEWLYHLYKCGFGGILADEMGLGKSIQVIYFIRQILKEKSDANILIVAPTSLIYNWENEFQKFGQGIPYQVIAESKSRRLALFQQVHTFRVWITTYGLIRQDKDEYFKIPFELCVLDEAQNIKNPHAEISKIVKGLSTVMRLALTGTPIENSVIELWSIFDFIMPGYLSNLKYFQSHYGIHEMNLEALNRLSRLNKQISYFIMRRKKEDVLTDLPSKLENTIYLDMGIEQKKVYLAQLQKTQIEIEGLLKQGFHQSYFTILTLLTRLRQICIDPRIVLENYDGDSIKMQQLNQLIKDTISNHHKILVFTSYRMALKLVEEMFLKEGISYYVIDGSVTSKKRIELVDAFNQDDTSVFLIMLKAGGTGLNLTSADVVIHLDLWWNPQIENQATDRAHRIGQTKVVEVLKLVCKGTIEERILELQQKKKLLSNVLLEGEKQEDLIKGLSEEELRYLLNFSRE